ncbi:hypothetical protein GQ54DRAFT_30255 [Martensiomyces pterosporus]|nr:hypothetical protein GQ54DRAFT_30255 [Martensiomyces pterosporus]
MESKTSTLLLAHGPVSVQVPLRSKLQAQGSSLANAFVKALEDPIPAIELQARFIEFCSSRDTDVARAVFDAFDASFCAGGSKNIHLVVQEHHLGDNQVRAVLRGYFSVWAMRKAPLPALFSNPAAKLMAMFGGQSSMDNYIDEARWLLDTYGRLLSEFVVKMSAFLEHESRDPRIARAYPKGLDVIRWLQSPGSTPDKHYLLTDPVSIPVVCLIQLMHVVVLFKTLAVSPGELAQLFQGAAGHSQGAATATALSVAADEASFYAAARKVLGILMLCGAVPQLVYPPMHLSLDDEADAVEHEGKPCPMVSVHGISQRTIEGYISEFNSQMPSESAHVYLSLINTHNRFIVSAKLDSAVHFVRFLRAKSASPGDDQSRIPFPQRKPVIFVAYTGIDTPYHCTLVSDMIDGMCEYAGGQGWSLCASDMQIPVYSGDKGQDIRSQPDLTRYMFECMCVIQVNWPAASDHPGITHIVDFGPGGHSGFGSLTYKNIEGRGVSVICAGSLLPRAGSPLGTKADLYKKHLADVTSAPNWLQQFGPRLVRTAHDSKIHIDTGMHRVIGQPPLMVAGMTPTTVNESLVAAVNRARYHAELAGGGIHREADLSKKVQSLAGMIDPGQGITLNCIYVNQRQWGFQLPAILRMRHEGLPVDGLCIGGGVPSLEKANEIIASLKSAGFRHISLKPANAASIRDVVAIAQANRDFPVVLQWTGGRGGGHHSCEDFHQPILHTYSAIRSQPNIVLVAGSGFGDVGGTLPYITGDWSVGFGRAPMPFDGILLGSRVMVAKEAHTSQAAKDLIVATPGLDDSEWVKTYSGSEGGVMSTMSEYGEPNHVIKTRGALLVTELSKQIFSRPRDEQLPLLLSRKSELIERLNRDYMRPWFGKKRNGRVVDLEDMTYAEVAGRLVELTYVKHQSRWIDSSYCSLLARFLRRIEHRLGQDGSRDVVQDVKLESNPSEYVALVVASYPESSTQLLASEDIQFFVNLCRRHGQKPVPFIPVLDADFSIWLNKDIIWQAEDLDSVVDQDVQRVAIQQGPVAVRYSTKANEPVKCILDGIYHGQIRALLDRYHGGDKSSVPVVEYIGPEPTPAPALPFVIAGATESERVYHLPSDELLLPDQSAWISTVSGPGKSWLRALLDTPVIVQGTKHVGNFVSKAMRPRPKQTVTVTMKKDLPQAVEIINSSGVKELEVSVDDDVISLNIHHPTDSGLATLSFRLQYCPSAISVPIQEIMDGRDDRIHRFYFDTCTDHSAEASGVCDLLSPEAAIASSGFKIAESHIREYCQIIGNNCPHYYCRSGIPMRVPMDFLNCIVTPSLLRALASTAIGSGQLSVVHLYHNMTLVDGAEQLAAGDTIDSNAQLSELVNTSVGKQAKIRVSIYRNGRTIATGESAFVYRGVFIDPSLAFRSVKEDVMQMALKTADDVAVLECKEWFVYCDGTTEHLKQGSVLEFHLDSEYRFKSDTVYSRVTTAGQVLLRLSQLEVRHIANVSFECDESIGNPVTEYLQRHSLSAGAAAMFEEGGYQIFSTADEGKMVTVAPDTNWPYARAAADWNPIHTNPYVADIAGLPAPITHGLWTSASTRAFIEKYVADNCPGRARTHKVSFIGMVLPKDRLETKLFHVGMRDGRMLIKGQTFRQDGQLVLECMDEVEQPSTAYVFTGQGSQEVGMGMRLYEESAAARSIWDCADKHMLGKYGVSLLDIVRNNPMERTVYFGGKIGQELRNTYMSITRGSSGESAGDTKPTQLFPTINSRTRSYTFKSPGGLLHATQFTQPVILLFQLAVIADLRSKSLISKSAAFAGHSLGEYCALASVGGAFSVEDVVDISFYRGMLMQTSVERDEQNRSQYRMVAVDPSRVGHGFDESHLLRVVDAICLRGQGLLEIVNYNIRGMQYVVAGAVAQLAALGAVLDAVAARDIAASSDSGWQDIEKAIANVLAGGTATTLKRGRATIPLPGIDVPFHSSKLLSGVDEFRTTLRDVFSRNKVDLSSLHGRYIPNLTAVPFEVTKPYFELVFSITKSKVMSEELTSWDKSMAADGNPASRLATVLLIELLAYQFASPVQWIETQDRLFKEFGIRRFIEVGPSPVLCGMAKKTLRKTATTGHGVSILHASHDMDEIAFTRAVDAEVDMAAAESDSTGLVLPPPDLPAEQQPPPVGEHSTPTTALRAGITDVPVASVDVVQAMVSHKMKRTLDDIPSDRTIKELVGGRSTLQNEIIGDLHSEFGGKVPDKAEYLPLRDLASSIVSFSGTLGKHTSSLIARLFSSRMPGGFTQSVARNSLQMAYGLGPRRQDALLLVALAMEPASRLGTEAAAKAWLDSVAQAYAKRAGIDYSVAISGAPGAGSKVASVAISSAEFDRAQREQRDHVLQQIHLLACHAGIDLREGARSSELAKNEISSRQSELDELSEELGSAFVRGIRGVFDIRKARHYDSSWNWARQDALEWINGALLGETQQHSDGKTGSDAARLHSLASRTSPALLSLIAAMISAMEKGCDGSSQHAIALARRIYTACKGALGLPPLYKELSTPTRPSTKVGNKGDVEYTEVLREGEVSFVEYVEHMQSGVIAGEPPLLHLREKSKPGAWTCSAGLSRVYFNALEQMAADGLSFSGKTALVTGCGKDSIGADILRGLLAGGAQVVATTSSYSRRATLFYEELYKEFGARGSKLVVVPFNQGSASDVRALVEYIYSTPAGGSGLGWDLDFVIPFAAISEVGSDIAGLDSRSELAHRVMLTNVLRLVGEIKSAKARRSYRSRPSLVVLPLSPNHGDFGGDGLYGESKLGLETAFSRWKSESWKDYLSIAGAVIGWTRGTGLMDRNSHVARDVESLGVRTFSTREMAFNVLGLLHPDIVGVAEASPVWADMAGGLQRLENLGEAVDRAGQSIREESRQRRKISLEASSDYAARWGHHAEASPAVEGGSLLANHKHRFPAAKSYEQLEHLRHLQGMVNLDKVVVVTGYGEVGPFGNAENRWEMEAFGEFSLEGCIELAWIMGLIKHHNGPLKSTGAVYTGWVDVRTGAPIKDREVKTRYEEYILEHTGIRLIEPELVDGYDPNKKTFMRELQIEHDMEPFEASASEAAAFKHQNGDKADIWPNKDGSWSVRFLRGAIIFVPKALRFDRLVAGLVPTGWSPARYGIPADAVEQVDPVTCYAIVAAVEALVRSGITDPYELYSYFHVSQIGNTMGSGVGGGNSIQRTFRHRSLDMDVKNDAIQEMFINTTAAWINMLLLSSSGPIKPTVGACATSVLSIDVAVETIQSGKAKVVLAGGFESFTEESSCEFAQMGATNSSQEELASGRTPKEMSRPCTSTRSGFVEGQGAGVVALMSASAAIEFGAPIYGIVAMSGTATDKQGGSIPAPGRGILTSAREIRSGASPRLLDLSYRRRQLAHQLAAIEEWRQAELGAFAGRAGLPSGEQAKEIQQECDLQRRIAIDTWGHEFWKQDARISPLRGSLAVWGLTVDDIGVASFHGTSTVANDKNESEVLNRQIEHLGRTPGLAVPAVCQKWLTGHSKGAAAAFMLNGVLQSLRTGIVPGNRNADNIAAELEEYEHIVYPSRSIQIPGIKAGLLKSFGFGQVGGEILVVHPDYLLAALTREQLEQYNEKLLQREAKSYRYWQDTLVGNHPFVQVKSSPPYSNEQEPSVYLDPLARARYDSVAKQYKLT